MCKRTIGQRARSTPSTCSHEPISGCSGATTPGGGPVVGPTAAAGAGPPAFGGGAFAGGAEPGGAFAGPTASDPGAEPAAFGGGALAGPAASDPEEVTSEGGPDDESESAILVAEGFGWALEPKATG